ncbi:MAG: DUF1559 family PulG-like putative transporter [Armatimonadota bacterium]
MSTKKHSGFTLIELLVVIAIIAVLTAIVFPVLASAREKARSTQCQSNLRQISIAISSYTQDWDGYYPNTGNPLLWMGRFWRWPLKEYLKLSADPVPGDPLHSTKNSMNILLCPSDSKAKQSFDGTSYAYSMTFYVSPADIDTMSTFGSTVTAPGPRCESQSESAVLYPSEKAMVTEWQSNHKSPNVGWNNPATAWQGARNYLFADGHCKYLQSTQICSANDGLPDINLTRNGIAGKDIN